MYFNLELQDDFKVKIGPHYWTVVFVDSIPNMTQDEHGWGYCCLETETIFLRNGMSYSMRLSTFLHEVLHALEFLYDIKIKHNDLNLVADLLTQVLMDTFGA